MCAIAFLCLFSLRTVQACIIAYTYMDVFRSIVFRKWISIYVAYECIRTCFSSEIFLNFKRICLYALFYMKESVSMLCMNASHYFFAWEFACVHYSTWRNQLMCYVVNLVDRDFHQNLRICTVLREWISVL